MIVPVAISSILVSNFLPAVGNYYPCILLQSLIFEHTPNRYNHSDSYTDWGNMAAVLSHLIIIAVLVVLI